MKYLICSDLHGSVSACDKILAAFIREKADKLILLGDVYYHGPRNPLPKKYLPKGVAKRLNENADKLIVLRGNCDAEVDQMISQFTFSEQDYCLESGGKSVYLTHGHKVNLDNPPEKAFDALIYGHFHKGYVLRSADGKVYANPGSPSLPKDGFRGYLVLDSGVITLKKLNGKTLREEKI